MLAGSKTETIWRRWASLIVLGVVLIPVTLLQPYRNGPPIRSDGDGYHFWTYAILRGDLLFSWYRGDRAPVALIQPDPTQHRYICKYPPGVALVRLPLMALVTDASRGGPPYSCAEHWACLFLSAVCLLAIGALGLSAATRLGAPLPAAHTAVLVLTFGTGLFHYGTYDAAFSHVYSALGTALLLWLAVVAVQDRSGRLPLSGTLAVLVLFVLVRNTNVIIAVFWSAGFLLWGWRQGITRPGTWLRNAGIVALGVGLGTAIQLALNYNAFGRWQLSSYGDETFDWSRLMLPEVLWSFERGLFTYYPVLAIVLLGGLVVRSTRLATAWLTLLVLAFALLYGFWSSWFLGCGFGHRGFVELVPLAVPLFALVLGRAGEVTRYRLRLGATLATCITVLLMLGYWRGTYPMCHATPRQYANHITLSLYGRAQRLLAGSARKSAPAASSHHAPSSGAAGTSSGGAARNTAPGPAE